MTKRRKLTPQEHDRLELQALFREVPAFRRYMWRTLQTARLFHSSHHAEPSQAAYNEGWRALGLAIMSDLEAAQPGAFAMLMREGGVPDVTPTQTEENPNDDPEPDPE